MAAVCRVEHLNLHPPQQRMLGGEHLHAPGEVDVCLPLAPLGYADRWPDPARIELARLPHLAIPYVRHGLLGLYTAAIELLASNVNARIVKTESTEPTRLFVLRIDWD